MIDPRRDPVRNRAAGVQEGVIGLAKQRLQAKGNLSLIEFIKVMAVGLGGEPAMLTWDATRFAGSHIQSARNRVWQIKSASQLQEEGIWRRLTVDKQLGSMLMSAMELLKRQLRESGCETVLTWKELCHPDSRQPLTLLLQFCFELSGGSHLSEKAYSAAWGRFITTHVKYWASTKSSKGLAAKKMFMSTANNNQIRMTLQLFANSIQADPAVLTKGLEAFRLHTASRLETTRAQVEVIACT